MTEIKLTRKYPCWHCGQHYIAAEWTDPGDEGESRHIEVRCPDCGRLCSWYGTKDIGYVEKAVLDKVLEVPVDPEARKRCFDRHRFIDTCERNMGERIWEFDGYNTCYGSEFSICPTTSPDGRTLYLECSDGEYGGFMSVGNARALRDALDKWLGEE